MLRNLVIVIGLVLAAGAAWAETPPRTITVTGEGRIDVEPDMATVRLGVETQAPGAREAIDTNNRAMAGVLDRLRAVGIEDRDLQTSSFFVETVWDRNNSGQEPKVTGFSAVNMLTVRVRDIDRLGEVIGEVTRDGANRFSGVTFGLQDSSDVKNAVRRDAVAKAQALAELYAEAAGVKLGPLRTLSEFGADGVPTPMGRAQMETVLAEPVMATGEVSLSARVTLVYEIAD